MDKNPKKLLIEMKKQEEIVTRISRTVCFMPQVLLYKLVNCLKLGGINVRKILCLSILLTTSTVYAQEDGWYLVTASSDGNHSYSIKLGSGERSQNKKGELITVVVGKTSDKKLRKIEIVKWYVTDADCSQEYGNLIVLTVDGTYQFESPFAKGSRNIASSIAGTICDVTANDQRKAAGKSI